MGARNIERLLEALTSSDEVDLAATLDLTGSWKIGGTAVTSTAAELNIMDGVTATAAEINQHCDESANVADLTATNTLTAADSGKTLFLNSATEFATTLPSPAAGLRFKFICKAAPSGASYTIVTASSANIIIGGINELEVDTANDGPYSAAADTITFVASLAVVGDWCELISDGTSWYLTGQANADGGITVTQAS